MTLATRLRARREQIMSGTLAAVVVALWLVWTGASGGYSENVWYPSTLGMISLWVVTVAWRRRLLPQPRAARIALLAFAMLVVFNYLSIAWAGSKGSALDSANQLTLYLLGAWVLALLPWTAGGLAAFAGVWSFGVFVLCAVAVARAAGATSLTLFFVNGRFATPMQYSNATGALGVMGMWPALILSSRRELPWWLRGGATAIAVFLAMFAVLPESRAALLGLIVTAPLALVVMSDRLRLLARMVLAGGAVALCLPGVLRIDDAVNAGRRVQPALHHTVLLIVLATAVALVLGLALAALEDRWTPAQRWRRFAPGRRLITVAAIVAGLVVIAAAVAVEPHVARLVHTTIRQGRTDASTGSDRLLSTSPEERFDYARVALKLFAQAPIGGIGSGNFGRRYDALRHFLKHSNYTHNLPLRVLCETGIIGMLLFLAMLLAVVVGLVRVARRRSDLGRAAVGIAFTVSGYFLVHSCLDWVDAFPALAVPAIALPLAAMSLDPTPATGGTLGWLRSRPRLRAGAMRLGWSASALAAVAVFVAAGSAYLSLQYTNRAFAIFANHPQHAYHDLDVARSLDPLSTNPITSMGTVALYAGDLTRSEQAFTTAVAHEDDWYPRLELALLDAHAGQFPAALAQVNAAGRLDVKDPLITEARTAIEHHQRINPITFNEQIAQEGNSSAFVQTAIR